MKKSQLVFKMCFIFALLLINLIYYEKSATADSLLDQCCRNINNIGQACERYSMEHQGHYPTSLNQLIKEGFWSGAICPASGKDTYSSGYSSTKKPDTYKVCCKGSNHTAVGIMPNYPRMSSSTRLEILQSSNDAKDQAKKVVLDFLAASENRDYNKAAIYCDEIVIDSMRQYVPIEFARLFAVGFSNNIGSSNDCIKSVFIDGSDIGVSLKFLNGGTGSITLYLHKVKNKWLIYQVE